MVSVKVEDLEGAALDWAVAKATGKRLDIIRARSPAGECSAILVNNWYWSPSTDWSQGGPLIEKYRCDVGDTRWGQRFARVPYTSGPFAHGMYTLETCMRAIVAALLADELYEVDVPEELAP